MKTIIYYQVLSEEHLKHKYPDSGLIDRSYRINRGFIDLSELTFIDFDIFRHLNEENIRLGRRIEVLEGGCGCGDFLTNLKRGFESRRHMKFYKEYPAKNKMELSWLDGVNGLGKKIRTTGITLNIYHLKFLGSYGSENEIDEIIVGAIERYQFNRKYDFIFDFYGGVYYFPEEVLPVYGKILNEGGLVFTRLFLPKFPQMNRKYIEEYFNKSNILEIKEYGFNQIDCSNPIIGDFLLRKK